MSGINVGFKHGDAKRLLRYLDGIDDGAEKAIYRTLVATQKKAKTEASKLIRSNLALTKKYVDSKLSLGKPSYSNLTGRLIASKRGLLMTAFKYKPLKEGGYEVGVSGTYASPKFKSMPGAFLLPRLKNSNVPGLAIRKDHKLKMLYAPSVSQALNEHMPALQKQMAAFGLDRLKKEVAAVLRQKGF